MYSGRGALTLLGAVPDSYRILSSPVRLTGQPDLGHVAALVATDALVRRARAEGREVAWAAATLAGDLVGQYAADSVQSLDLPPIMGVTIYATFFIVLFSVVVDLLYAWLDPRIRPT